MQNSGNVVFTNTKQIPTEVFNLSIDMTHIIIAVVVIVILAFLAKRIMEVVEFKNRTDNYVDSRIDIKLRPLNTDIEGMRQEQEKIIKAQALNCEDIQEIKLQMVEMNTSLKFIAEIINDFRHSYRKDN